MPPSPADYTQQLFGYLQAWRQYLEQATGATPAPTTQQSAGSTPPPDEVVAPDNDWSVFMPADNLSTDPFSRPVNVRPDNEYASRATVQRPSGPAEQLRPSSRESAPVPERRSAFAKAQGRADPAAPPPAAAPQSLYSRRAPRATEPARLPRPDADRARPRPVAENTLIRPENEWIHHLD
jgi:hypothetical protein